MVDWTTHLGLGWLLSKTQKLEKTPFLIGCVLPDLVRWPGYPLQLIINARLIDALLKPSHTILGALLLSIAASIVFTNYSPRTTLALFAGSVLHLSLDTLMKARIGYGVYLLWPLSWNTYALDLSSMGDPIPPIISIALCCLVLVYERMHAQSRTNFKEQPFVMTTQNKSKRG